MNPAVRRVALFLVGYLVILVVASLPKGMAPPRYADLVWGTLSSLAILALTQFSLSRETRTRRDVGLDADAYSLVRLLAGFALGLAVYAATMGVSSLILGPIRLTAPILPSLSTWVVVLTSYLALASMEELGFRAYALRTLVRAIGAWRAQLTIALAFGASHLAFGWPWQTILLGVVPSALLFGVVALRSGGVAMPIGLHAALNIAQWLVGAKDARGVWTLSVDPQHTERLTTFAPMVGLAVTMLAVVAVVAWPTRTIDVPTVSSATD